MYQNGTCSFFILVVKGSKIKNLNAVNIGTKFAKYIINEVRGG